MRPGEDAAKAASRLATAEDLAVVRRITDRAYAAWVPVLGYPPQPMGEDYNPRIARGEVVLAYRGNTVLGLIVVEPGPSEHLIYSVAVDPDHAGAGLGPFLMADAERRASAAGASAMTLYTNALMARNIALYQRLGYRESGRRPHPLREGITIVDLRKTFLAS